MLDFSVKLGQMRKGWGEKNVGKQWIKKKITTEGKYATRKTQSRGGEEGKRGDKDCEIHKEDEKEGELQPEELDLTGCVWL